jgi:hypothetical protein
MIGCDPQGKMIMGEPGPDDVRGLSNPAPWRAYLGLGDDAPDPTLEQARDHVHLASMIADKRLGNSGMLAVIQRLAGLDTLPTIPEAENWLRARIYGPTPRPDEPTTGKPPPG